MHPSHGCDTEEVRRRLEAHGIQPTPRRVAVAESVIAFPTHPTAEEVVTRVRGRLPRISQATVYDALNRLVAAGVLHQIQKPGELVRYDGNIDTHHHLWDRTTGRVWDIPPELVEVRVLGGLPEGVRIERIVVTMEGVSGPRPGEA